MGIRPIFHNDHLGSTSVITNQAGGLVEATSYDPWGEVKSGGTKSKFLYTGQEKDTETGLHYYNARYYDPHIRRFTQPDDIIQDVYNPQDLNKYSYVRNNPLRYTDPSGRAVTIKNGKIVSTITILNTPQPKKTTPAIVSKVAPYYAAAQSVQPKQTSPNSNNTNTPSVQGISTQNSNLINQISAKAQNMLPQRGNINIGISSSVIGQLQAFK